MGWIVSKHERNNSCVLLEEGGNEVDLAETEEAVDFVDNYFVKEIVTNHLNVVATLPKIEPEYPQNIKLNKLINSNMEIKSTPKSPILNTLKSDLKLKQNDAKLKKTPKITLKNYTKPKQLPPLLNNLMNENGKNKTKIKKSDFHKDIYKKNDFNKEFRASVKDEVPVFRRKKSLSPLDDQAVEKKKFQEDFVPPKKITIKNYFKEHEKSKNLIHISNNKVKPNKKESFLIKTNIVKSEVKINQKEDITSFQRNKCLSPLNVGDLERKIIQDDFIIEEEEKESFIINNDNKNNNNDNNNKNCKKKLSEQRAQSANILRNKCSNNTFNNIILDFNNKLENLMQDKNLVNSYCRNCCEICKKESKTTAKKITFFFLKKYGNVGKFILARLNDFFDNMYQKENDFTEVNFHKNDFPLPCNINDVKFSGDLKLNYKFSEKTKFKKMQSKLPILVIKKDCNKIIEETKSEPQNNNNKYIIKNKLRFPLRKKCNKTNDAKVEEVNDSQNTSKNTSKKVKFKKKSPSNIHCYDNIGMENHNDIHYNNVELTNPKDWGKFCYEDVVNVLKIESYSSMDFKEGIMENDDKNTSSIIYFNEEEVSSLANKLIDDLWNSSSIRDYTFNSMVTD